MSRSAPFFRRGADRRAGVVSRAGDTGSPQASQPESPAPDEGDTSSFLPEWLRRRAFRSSPPEEATQSDEEQDTTQVAAGTGPGPGSERAARLRNWAYLVFRAVGLRWRRSLQFRMVVLAATLSVVAALIVGIGVAAQVRDRLLEARRVQVDQEAARRGQLFQDLVDASSARTAEDVEQVVRDALTRITTSGDPDPTGVVLLRSPSSSDAVVAAGFAQGALDVAVVPLDLREAVRSSSSRQIRSVTVSDNSDPGSHDPGLVVGQQVRVPLGGSYELYTVTSLAAEQRTLDLIQRSVLLGFLGLVFMVGLIAYGLARFVVTPVREAALAAERLASGDLSERLAVRGEDELARLARSFNGMAAGLQAQIHQLEELSRVQQRFVSDVSHELRTPLTTMRMAGEVIYDSRSDLDPAAERSAELLNAQLDRFDSLLADLLEISRFDAGAAALAVEPTELSSVVRAVTEHAMPLAERKDVQIRLHLPTTVTAEVDRVRIERILRNLVNNAIEHSEGKPVDIWLAGDDTAAAVVVRDHGIGLSAHELPRVFDKFWRADPARARTTGGTGLGLAIAAEDARLHGGWLQVWGEPGAGAAFRLTVPLTQETVVRSSPLPLTPAAEEAGDCGQARSLVPADGGPDEALARPRGNPPRRGTPPAGIPAAETATPGAAAKRDTAAKPDSAAKPDTAAKPGTTAKTATAAELAITALPATARPGGRHARTRPDPDADAVDDAVGDDATDTGQQPGAAIADDGRGPVS